MDPSESKKKRIVALIMYICFGLTGMLSVSVGALIPFIRTYKEGVGYGEAGLIVSIYAIGNLLANIGFGYIAEKFGEKGAILAFDLLFPLSFVLVIKGDGFLLIAAAFFMAGLSRGACSNCCNTMIGKLFPGSAAGLNGLHAVYSVGAFIFPILLTTFTGQKPENWIYPCIIMVGLGCLGFLMFAFCPQMMSNADKKDFTEQAANKYGSFKEKIFWAVTTTLFFYLCVESGIIGWLVTYFIDTGYISDIAAQYTTSVLWVMVLIGRLAAAYLSKRTDKRILLKIMGLGFTVFFIALLFVRNATGIIILVMGIGFFLAGIFPTTLSFAGELSARYYLAVSFILTASGLGAVIMPSVIVFIADRAGILSGMASVTAAVFVDLICIFLLCARRKVR